MYVLLYLEIYALTFTSVEILWAAELFPSSSDRKWGIDECRAGVIRWEGKDPDSVVLYKNVE